VIDQHAAAVRDVLGGSAFIISRWVAAHRALGPGPDCNRVVPPLTAGFAAKIPAEPRAGSVRPT
jgi:hypothetical protein